MNGNKRLVKSKRYSNFSLFELIIVLAILVIFFSLLPGTGHKASEKSLRISCLGNLKQVGLALRMYSQEYKGEYPPYNGARGLEMLRSGDYLENMWMYTCPSTKDWDKARKNNEVKEDYCSYVYRAGLNEANSVDSAIAWDKPINHSKYGNIIFIDWDRSGGFAGANWMENIK
ncbi:MAG TPA: hypothetical protein DCZ94_10570 [Lentisphaeria bacterium]|nr:MAG: hypothetical protein A2X48_06445 [Lentisphaerae bacterium GWF2_49_21]HBC87388.1 hypothetical protein [Lentisphaeria bacterium]